METNITDISPKTNLVVVGVSTDPKKYGYKIFTSLVEAGYQVKGINPKGGEVAGKILFKSLADLPTVPEVVITVVPPKATMEIIKICQELKVPTIWMQPGSSSDETIEMAKSAGLKVISNTCFMIQKNIW